jgi:hypothetical protein
MVSVHSRTMKANTERILHNISITEQWFQRCPETLLREKPAPGKWSKIEILGHLIDSAVNNLKRFTEIHYQPKPYQVIKYDQDALVAINDYQHAQAELVLSLWTALNRQITRVMEAQTEDTLSLEVISQDGDHTDLRYLMTDYVDHMEHHLRQIGVISTA